MGSEVSRGGFLRDRVVKRLLGQQLLESRILLLELFQTLGLVHPKATVLLPPAIVGLLGDPELAHHVARRRALGQLDLGLPQLPDDLLRRVSLPGYLLSPCLDPNNLAGSI